jgi:C4-dicarboxylate transporter
MTNKALIITGIGIAIGALAGYAYYFYVGCASGTCAITSKPLNSTLYGALMGGLVFNMFVKDTKSK